MEGSTRPIVVGVDGSEPARRALRFAAEEARLRGAPLRAVSAWQPPTMTASPPGYPVWPDTLDPGWPDVIKQIEVQTTARLEHEIAEVLGEGAGLDIQRVVRDGPPAEVLLAEAESAVLLVVGSRGHGGFKGLLLGSVSRAVTDHAPCPVTIVRAPEDKHHH